MLTTKDAPYLAFSFFLLTLLTGCLLVQTAGHVLDVPLAGASLFIAFPFALWLTYGHCFPPTVAHVKVAIAGSVLLTVIGILSRHWLDFTSDGLGYQQPSAEAILGGWNPFRSDSPMFWQNIYPSGATQIEAALAFLYASVEDAKMVQVWWLFIALPVLLSGLCHYKLSMSRVQVLLTVACVLSATVLTQLLTHYVDALTYLAGLTFIGGLLLYDPDERRNPVASVIMAASVCFLVNTKLSGIYHAFMLCGGAVVFLWIRTKRFPWKTACLLLSAGAVAVLIIGYRPYVTSFIQYGRLFPDDTENFSGFQRPSSFDALYGFERLFYSLFSVTGGTPHEPAQLKFPWEMRPLEWKFAGEPDARTGGLGIFFALGFVASLGLFIFALIRKLPIDKPLASLACLCLLSSALFPQSWWLRYVPFAYAVPFLLLLSIAGENKAVQRGMCAVIGIFAVNSAIAFNSADMLFLTNQKHFLDIVASLRTLPAGSVYLVPPAANYVKYNGAYLPLTRRLREQGVETVIKVDASCPHKAEAYAEFLVCY